jgi:hypothetical protein
MFPRNLVVGITMGLMIILIMDTIWILSSSATLFGSLVRSSKKKARRSTRSKAASTTGPKPVVMITNLLDPGGG